MASDTTEKVKKKKKKKKHRFFWFLVRCQILLMLLVAAGVAYYFLGGYAQTVQQLKHEAATMVATTSESMFVPSQSSEIYDADGNLISERKGEKNAQYLAYEDIPKDFVAAMISIEDKKFYRHDGVDFKAVVRAATALMKAKINNTPVSQGASTITMQLAKLMYLKPDRSWQYKVKQMFLAMELERRYSKEKILEFYLNNIFFSNGYYGIEAASIGYFNCEPSELNLSQVAFLCAIPNSPSYYDPVTNYEHTIERRNRILKNMLEDGKITQETYYEAVKTEIVLNRPQKGSSSTFNNYVDTYTYYCATRALMEQEGFIFQNYFSSEEQEMAYDEQFDAMYAACQKRLYAGGYRIYTSIDMEKQNQLQRMLDDALADFTDTYESGAYEMQGAAVCIDNETGYVVAIIGGRDQDLGPYTLNRAYQSHRQPGSSIKPLIVYTPVFERGYEPDTIVDDSEIEDGPANANGYYAGEVELRYAVEQSLNTVAWQLYREISPAVGLSYLKKMNFTGIDNRDYIPATALGGFTKGVSALEMAAAYATLENDGRYRQPTCIKEIIDADQNVVYSSQKTEVVIYEKNAARMMTDVLGSAIREGTGKNMCLEDRPCAGKTGTTNDYKDGWFVGYTRYYTTSVWVGCDYPKRIEDLRGNTYPGYIWYNFMNVIHEGLPPTEFLPYARLSDEFVDRQEQEQREQEERREEAQQHLPGEQNPPENQPGQDDPGEQNPPENQPGQDDPGNGGDHGNGMQDDGQNPDDGQSPDDGQNPDNPGDPQDGGNPDNGEGGDPQIIN